MGLPVVIAWLVGIASVSFVLAVTPGPNNVMFAASGARVGYLRTVPAVLGMLLGFALMVAASLAGIGALVADEPRIRVLLSLLASGYMAWLAVRLWRAPGAGPATADGAVKLLSWWRFAAFQFANPKTWLATVAFVSGFLGVNGPGGTAVDLLGIVWFLTVIAVAANIWVIFGATLRARLGAEHWKRVNRSLAVLAAGSVVSFWV